jgi:hypothetical protein
MRRREGEVVGATRRATRRVARTMSGAALRIGWLVVLSLATCHLSLAQYGHRANGFAFVNAPNGLVAAPGSSIHVLVEEGQSLTCGQTPYAAIYSFSGGSYHSISQPGFVADSNGNYDWYALPTSIYREEVNNGSTCFIIPNITLPQGVLVLYSSNFPGASSNAQALAACQSTSGAPVTVIIPSTAAADNTVEAYPQYCSVQDLRGSVGPNQFGTEGTAYSEGTIFRSRFATAPNSVQNYGSLECYLSDDAGGYNTSGGPKTTYICMNAISHSVSQGTHYGVQSIMGGLGEGDELTFYGQAQCYGGSNATGDEGCEAGHFEADQGSLVFTGTVATYANIGSTSTITYTSPVNESVRGELRWMVDTNASKIYSTGTITGISGVPPVVTGSGTGWATQFGTGARTGDLCFALANDTNTGYTPNVLNVIPVASIGSNTSLTLNLQAVGVNKGYSSINPTGNYQIFECSQVAPGGLGGGSGDVVVTNGYTSWAAADTFAMYPNYDAQLRGLIVDINPTLPMAVSPGGIWLINEAAARTQGYIPGLSLFGPWTDGVACGTLSNSCIQEDSTGNAFLMYQSTADSYLSWGWDSNVDFVKFGCDKTTGACSVTDGTNGQLLEVDQNKVTHVAAIVQDKATHVTSGEIALGLVQGPYGTSSGWGTGASVTSVKNDSNSLNGLTVFTVGTSPGTYPMVEVPFEGISPSSVTCQATFIDQTGIAPAIPYYEEGGTGAAGKPYIGYIWPGGGVPPSWTGTSPTAGESLTLTWSCAWLQ